MTRLRAAAVRAAACSMLLPGAAAAQYTVTAENGDSVQFESAALRAMLDTARALYADLEEDPRVAYMTPVGFPGSRVPVSLEDPEASYPWNVVTVLSDSTVDARSMPANFREADRAYYNYVVQRMRVVRGTDPDVSCDSLLALEEKVVGSFADGWILSRTLFGGPAFAPLDELVFARRAGLLRALLARHNDRQLGACAGQWAEANLEKVAAYDTWQRENFPAPSEDLDAVDPDSESPLDPGESGPDEPLTDPDAAAPGEPGVDGD
jgi:hypothetical protein